MKRWVYRIASAATVTALAMTAAMVLVACTQKSAQVLTLKREPLFSLDYGAFEKELNLFSIAAVGGTRTSLTLRDGLFYIVNGEAQKLMQLNSYGDLLKLYYNPESNPVSLQGNTDMVSPREVVVTQRGIAYPFNVITAAAVDEQKNLFVVERLPQDRQEFDTEHNLHLAQVVLRFSGDGVYLDYLGQNGPGGTPFPFIDSLHTTKNNELVVVCWTDDGVQVYWFSADGYLQYAKSVENGQLPNPFTEGYGDEMFLSLKNVLPDFTQRQVYLEIDYYTSVIDLASNTQVGIDYNTTLLYPFDIATGKFLSPVTIPPYERSRDGTQKNAATASGSGYKGSYDLIGQTESGWFFFAAPDDTGYTLQVVHPHTQRILKRHLDIDVKNLSFYTFSLSPEGILAALLAGSKSAQMVWWRTDSFIDALLKS